MRFVTGVFKHYEWGDRQAIPRLLGVEPDDRPVAELWFGTHPSGPATVGGGPLADISGSLPYLLKLLAAAEPLSLQVHPTATQAAAGFAAGRLPDPHPKPELLVALSSFRALSGVRPVEATAALLERLDCGRLAAIVRDDGAGAALEALYRGRVDIEPIVAACAAAATPEARLVTELHVRYPGDPSVVATLLLNHLVLDPGQALFLDAGNLHAYLSGLGVEVMGASDNVVRGGLTVKPVDVDELLATVDPTPLADPLAVCTETAPGVFDYVTTGTPFHARRHELAGPRLHVAASRELVLCTAGGDAEFGRGAVAYVAAGEEIRLPGASTVFVVGERT